MIILIKLLVLLWLASPWLVYKLKFPIFDNIKKWYDYIPPYNYIPPVLIIWLFEISTLFVGYLLFMFTKMIIIPGVINFFNFMVFTW